jgi:asparagine synthetase B (glutamine-hydrolysing)
LIGGATHQAFAGIAAQFARSGAAPLDRREGQREPAFSDPCVAIWLSPSRGCTGETASFADIHETQHHVLACEGFILNLDEVLNEAGIAAGPTRAASLNALVATAGASGLDRLNGGYAIVHWNRNERTGLVHVCKFGQRSLLVRRGEDGCTFAPDPAQLRCLTGVGFNLDPGTLRHGFMTGTVPGTATSLRGVSKVAPGSTLGIARGDIVGNTGAGLPGPDPALRRASRQDCLDAADAAMTAAMARVGSAADHCALMVGAGVDSALVGSYAAPFSNRVLAITHRMPGELDEADAAAAMVGMLGLRHLIVPYRAAAGSLVAQVAEFVRLSGEPAYWNQLGPAVLQLIGDLPHLPAGFVTGAGADRMFLFRSGRRPSVKRILRQGVFWPVAHHATRIMANRVLRHTYILGSDFDLLDRDLMGSLVRFGEDGPTDDLPRPDPADADLKRMQHAYVDYAWQNVRMISQLANSAGSEALFPYLDDELARVLLSLPEELKINKVLLRLLLRRKLGARPVPTKKRGYWAHTIRWRYRAGAMDDALDLMSERRTIERGIYSADELARLVAAYRNRTATEACHPAFWQLLLFEVFCREFVDDN